MLDIQGGARARHLPWDAAQALREARHSLAGCHLLDAEALQLTCSTRVREIELGRPVADGSGEDRVTNETEQASGMVVATNCRWWAPRPARQEKKGQRKPRPLRCGGQTSRGEQLEREPGGRSASISFQRYGLSPVSLQVTKVDYRQFADCSLVSRVSRSSSASARRRNNPSMRSSLATGWYRGSDASVRRTMSLEASLTN